MEGESGVREGVIAEAIELRMKIPQQKAKPLR